MQLRMQVHATPQALLVRAKGKPKPFRWTVDAPDASSPDHLTRSCCEGTCGNIAALMSNATARIATTLRWNFYLLMNRRKGYCLHRGMDLGTPR